LSEERGQQLSFVGDQGGVLSVFDFRQSGSPIREVTLHPGGVVSEVKPMPALGLVITAGADKKILVLEPRKNFEPVLSLTDHKDFIYSMHVMGDIILSGAGNGWLLAHSASQGKCLYGLGANAAAVRAIHATPSVLVAAGDDGKMLVYDF
jgi:WD40 repeat protein